MANQRDKSKKLVGFYASPEEKKALEEAAKKRGISLSELLRRLAAGTLKLIIAGLLLYHIARGPKAWTAAELAGTCRAAWSKVAKLAK